MDFVAVVTLGILTICGCGFGALGGLGGTSTKYLCGLVVGVWLLFGAHWLGGATYLGMEVHLYTPGGSVVSCRAGLLSLGTKA